MAPEPKRLISGGLLRLLADTFVLLYKARHLSWRVNGDLGHGVRAIVRQDHRALDEAADKIARRIRTLGREVPPSYAELVGCSSIAQELGVRPEMEMIAQIVQDHLQILSDIDTLVAALPLQDDEETAHLLSHLSQCHENCHQSLGGLVRGEDQPVH